MCKPPVRDEILKSRHAQAAGLADVLLVTLEMSLQNSGALHYHTTVWAFHATGAGLFMLLHVLLKLRPLPKAQGTRLTAEFFVHCGVLR
eukprot:NODE_4455_length_1889_cov_6.287174.p7 GENE.NODE_4455_length_1889_cov_6.287174~~NODE_4455_length_1889_cov_6.287174.p7  ORF type:complete len:89 (+),score=21.69 NODE_4455_length_1889_cov_6.287174:1070-1336(+)